MHIEFLCKSSCLRQIPDIGDTNELKMNFVFFQNDKLIKKIEQRIRITANIVRDAKNYKNSLEKGSKAGRYGRSLAIKREASIEEIQRPEDYEEAYYEEENIIFNQAIALVEPEHRVEIRRRLLNLPRSKRFEILRNEQKRFASSLAISIKYR